MFRPPQQIATICCVLTVFAPAFSKAEPLSAREQGLRDSLVFAADGVVCDSPQADGSGLQTRCHQLLNQNEGSASRETDGFSLLQVDLHSVGAIHHTKQHHSKHAGDPPEEPTHNFFMQLLNFSICWAASWKIGAQFPRLLQLPMIIGFMVVGVLCGPYATSMLRPSTLDDGRFSVASVVEHLTLAFIAFSAGSELNLRKIPREQLRDICMQIFMMSVFMLGIGTVFVYGATTFAGPAFVPEGLLAEAAGCRWATAWFVAIILLAGSVIEVLAIYHETKGVGPVTQMMIGTTMLLDMCVVAMFAVGQTLVASVCPIQGGVAMTFQSAFVSILGQIIAWVVAGVMLACVLRLYMMLPSGHSFDILKSLLILVTGWACYTWSLILNDFMLTLESTYGLMRIDPLLVCMIAASMLQHFSGVNEEFRVLVYNVAPFVMPPFFTVVGARLDLSAIATFAATVPLLFVVRFCLIAGGSFLASVLSCQGTVVRNHQWMTLQCQSGVTLALLLQVIDGLTGRLSWTSDVVAIITGCVVVNQLVGPTLCRLGIQLAGEATQDESETNKVDAKDTSILDRPLNAEITAAKSATALVLPDVEEKLKPTKSVSRCSLQ